MRPLITWQPLSVGAWKKALTPSHLESSDSGSISKSITPSDNIFKVPATPKPNGSDLTVTTTLKERVVQVQPEFEHFIEVKPFLGLLLKEGQYYAHDPISGAYAVLDREVPKSKITRPTSTPSIASAIASSAVKAIPPPLDQQFGIPSKDEWDSEENIIEQLRREVENLCKKFGK